MLLERDVELTALDEQWGIARTSGRFVMISGEAGAGKSSLVHAFADGGSLDAPCDWGACDPLSTPRPLGPLHDVAASLGGDLPTLLDGDGQAHEIFAEVFERLRAEPRVLVVDDLHWADQGTIDLLRFLLRRLGATRSMVVGTVRDDEVGATHPLRALLGDVARSSDAVSLGLQPLSIGAVTAMIGERPVDPQWLLELTGGNAFFVREVLEHDGDELPVTVRDAVLAHTSMLDDEARSLLDLFACAPEGILDQLLPHLDVGIMPLRSVDEAGLIERGPRGITFRHDLCRLAVASAIPPGGDVALHQRLLDALEASGTGGSAVLAHHALAGRDPGRIRRHCTDAGRDAARSGAHTQAAAFFEAALRDGAPGAPAERAELLELLAYELYLSDRLPEAIRASADALEIREELGDRGAASADHEAISLYEWYSANQELARQHAAQAVSVLGEEGDSGRLGHANATEAYLAFQASDLDRARTFADRARLVASEAGDPALDVRLGIIDAASELMRGEARGRERILEILEGAGDHFDEIYSSGYSNLAYLDVEQRRLAGAAEVLETSLPLTIERDVPICRVWQLGARGRLHLLEGRWDDAVADTDAVLAGPSAPLARTWPHLVRALVALRRGEPADDDLEQAWELATRLGEPLRTLPVAAAFVERAWLRGRGVTGDDRVDEAERLLAVSVGPGLEWSRGDLAVWLHRLGRDVDAGAGDVAEPHRLQLEGAHVAAADAWADLAAPYERALALLDDGTQETIREGLELLDSLGADDVAAKVRRDLRERGITDIPARRRASTLANAAGLTARQVEVLALLDEGLTNAEIADRLYISPKTADHHVSAILSKLHVTSRRDAPGAGRDLGILR